jgi:hypothetical protein
MVHSIEKLGQIDIHNGRVPRLEVFSRLGCRRLRSSTSAESVTAVVKGMGCHPSAKGGVNDPSGVDSSFGAAVSTPAGDSHSLDGAALGSQEVIEWSQTFISTQCSRRSSTRGSVFAGSSFPSKVSRCVFPESPVSRVMVM